jgi:hypothetical protein
MGGKMQLVATAILRADGEPMARRYNGRLYVAQKAYSEKGEADALADTIRARGNLARVTQERKPRRMRTTQRYMWVVWDGPADAPAAVGDDEGVACP